MRTGFVTCLTLCTFAAAANALSPHRWNTWHIGAERTCTWDSSTATVQMATPEPFNPQDGQGNHVSADRDPLDDTFVGCEELPATPFTDVRTVDLTVGSGATYVWVRPPLEGQPYDQPDWTITPRAGSTQVQLVVVLSLDRGTGGKVRDVVASRDGFDFDGDGQLDVRIASPTWDVEVLADGAWGNFDLRAVPSTTTRVDGQYEQLRAQFGDGPTTFLGPTAGQQLDIRTGAADDVVQVAGPHQSEIRTYAGNDTIVVGDGGGSIMAGAGNDTIHGGSGNDHVSADTDSYGGSGLFTGDDEVHTGAGNDTVETGRGRDVVRTGTGDDTVIDAWDEVDVDAGPGADIVRIRGTRGARRAICGPGRDELWTTGRGRGVVRSRCERQMPSSPIVFEYLWHGKFGHHDGRPFTGNPRRYDGATALFGNVRAGSAVDLCAFDAAEGTMRVRVGGGGDSWAAQGIGNRVRCGDATFHSSVVRRVVVSTASPRAQLIVAPRIDARGRDERKYDFYPAPTSAFESPTIVITDAGTKRSDAPYRVRATPEGLDLNDDGDVDVFVHGVPNWNVELDTPAHGGRFDLRAVPSKPHELAWYYLATVRNTVYGPTSGPDVLLNANGGGIRHAIFEAEGDTVVLGPGDDNVSTYGGFDSVDSGAGNDVVNVSAGDDVVRAGAGDDIVVADIANKSKLWSRGDDRVWLGDGTNSAVLGHGEDVTRGGSGRDFVSDVGGLRGRIYLGAGKDQVDAWSTRSPILVACGADTDTTAAPRDAGSAPKLRSCERRVTNSNMLHMPWRPTQAAGEREWQ
ncbi:MAG: cya 1 [Thermoleophilia bacterium]|nr:cya 1 [Thermoleophilia bacterium]